MKHPSLRTFSVIALSAISAVSLLAADTPAPAAPQTANPSGIFPPPAGQTNAPAAGRRGGARGGARGAGGGRGARANLGPAPEIHAAIPNTLPGLLGKPLKWVSTGPLVSPQNDATHFLFSIKDPTISFIDGKWEIYATANMIMGPQAAAAAQPGGSRRGGTFNMVHVDFTDWKDAPNAKLFYMDQAGYTGYKCAPEMFYFTPQKKWYFTYQTQPPVYCTSDTPGDPKSWTKQQPFFQPGQPMPGLPIDYHFIGDGEYMYMFFTGDDGNFYRSRTKYADFPKGFSNPVVAMRGNRNTVFEAGYTYKIKGTDKYLTCVEGLGAGRYYRAYVADKLDGEWYPIQDFDTPEKPFAGKANMTFEDGVTPWSGQVSHGEMIRESNDERMVLDPNNLMFLYQGISDTDNRGDYGALAYKLGLLRAVKAN
jgi:hypothetical protein